MKSSNNPPTYPSAQPLPESRPISFFEQISGSMEFTKICDSSIPSIPIPNKIKILVTDSIPGTAHQILIAPKTYKTEKNTIHFFRKPPVSEIAPNIGPSIASVRPTIAVIAPQRD